MTQPPLNYQEQRLQLRVGLCVLRALCGDIQKYTLRAALASSQFCSKSRWPETAAVIARRGVRVTRRSAPADEAVLTSPSAKRVTSACRSTRQRSPGGPKNTPARAPGPMA